LQAAGAQAARTSPAAISPAIAATAAHINKYFFAVINIPFIAGCREKLLV
jgi:hypothetical protein